MNGWISLHRKIMNHWIWKKDRKFSEFEAWLYLLMCANHKENKVLFHNKLVLVRRGERITSESKLAVEWNWNRKTVHKFLDLLAEDNMIRVKRASQYTSYRIINYDTYQNSGTGKGTTTEQQDGQQRDTNNNDNTKINNEKKKEIIDFLNLESGKKYSDTESTSVLIISLLNQDYTVDDFKKVITIKAKQWLNHPEMDKYLRPMTLFSDKFEGYLNENEKIKTSNELNTYLEEDKAYED